jgi:chromosomal replication initiator protein
VHAYFFATNKNLLGVSVDSSLWQQCLLRLQDLVSQQEFIQWISPLQAEKTGEGIIVYSPNQYVLDTIVIKFKSVIEQVVCEVYESLLESVSFVVGAKNNFEGGREKPRSQPRGIIAPNKDLLAAELKSNLNSELRFDNFVEGKSNAVAIEAAKRVAELSSPSYNPFFLYGAVGLGKTHLMHAVGNCIKQRNKNARVLYLHSERFVSEMVKAFQNHDLMGFRKFYRSLDAFLIDDVQFFAGKDRSQEELFHTFNSLIEGGQQIIITCERYPKEITGLEERLLSRFGSGLTVAMQPPELETRVAILLNKAQQYSLTMPQEVAFFIAKVVRSNVRELEGALKRVVANAQFTDSQITIDFVKETLSDLLLVKERLISIDNIIKTVSEYYKVKTTELLSHRRTRDVARPRQVAMALCKELTNLSLPEIGSAFGGRDHTTVMHACRQVTKLKASSRELLDDFSNLVRILST